MLKTEKIHQYHRDPKILILKNYDMGRLKALFSIMDTNVLSSNCFITGPDIPTELFIPDIDLQLSMDQDTTHYANEEWVQSVAKELNRQHYDYNYSDAYLPEEKWQEYDVIFAATYDFMDREEQNKLVRYAKQSGKSLILGPKIPYLDRNFKDCTVIKAAIEGERNTACNITTLTDINQINIDFINLRKEYVYEEADIEISVHYETIGRNHLLYIANSSDQIKTVELNYQGKRSFQNIWRGKGFNKNNILEVEITPYTVSVWKVEMEDETNDQQ